MRAILHFAVRGGLLSMLLTVASATAAFAGDGCCAQCGCQQGCQKVCRLVSEDKKVTVTCWGCKEEDFCVPGRSTLSCRHCETVCDNENKPDSPCTVPQKWVWNEWIPGGSATIFTKKKLMKKTVTKTVPSFKWVVEDLCPACEAQSPSAVVPPGIEVPPPPSIARSSAAGQISSSTSKADSHVDLRRK